MSCSCGAILPEDARFCHKCGAPQYAEDIARMNTVEGAAQPQAPEQLPPVQFRTPSRIGLTNGRAVRITLAVAAMSLLAIILVGSVAPSLAPAVLVAGGFAAVRLYLSRTSEQLTPSGAAVLGAMPWLWLSLPLSLLEAFGAAVLVFTAQGRDVVKAMKNPEVTQLLDDPAKVFSWLIVVILVGTVSGALGGILAVRWQPRNGPSH